MTEHEEILECFEHFVRARKVFAKYEKLWFSGNDNHIGDVGEYWTMRYFASDQPALNETEAILLAKVGSVIDAFGLTRDDVDFYIRSVAVLYEGKTFKAELEQKPLMTAEELDAVLNPRDSLAEIDSFHGRIDDLKARVEAIEAKITSA